MTAIPQHRPSRYDLLMRSATIVSSLGLIALLVGRVAGAKGFSSSDKDVTTLSQVCFFVFLAGLVLAIVGGIAAWVAGRRSGQPGTRTLLLAAGYLILAVAGSALLTVL